MQELVDLSLIGKRLHWAVVGHAFWPVHEQLDELVASWRDLADVVAERAVAFGYVPDGQARAVAAGLKAAVGHVAEPPAFGVPSCRSAAIRRSERAIMRCS